MKTAIRPGASLVPHLAAWTLVGVAAAWWEPALAAWTIHGAALAVFALLDARMVCRTAGPRRERDVAETLALGNWTPVRLRLTGEGGEWAEKSRSTLETRSPTSLKVTFRQLTEGATREFDPSMVVEYRISQACVAGHDFLEGIRREYAKENRLE